MKSLYCLTVLLYLHDLDNNKSTHLITKNAFCCHDLKKLLIKMLNIVKN